MEKRGSTSTDSLKMLLKQANDGQETLVISMDGMHKYANGKGKPGIAVIATGSRAEKLRQILESLD